MIRAFVMRLFAAGLLLASLGGSAFAGEVELAWQRNTEPGVAGYIVWYGTQSGIYRASVDVGNRAGCTLTGLQDGQRYYFAVQAYDSSRVMSPLSAEVFADVTDDAAPPSAVPGNGPRAGSTPPEDAAGLSGDYYIHHPVRGSWLTGWVTMAPGASDPSRMDVIKGWGDSRQKVGEWAVGASGTDRVLRVSAAVGEPNPSSSIDLVVWQASTGNWYVLNSNDGIAYASRLVVALGLGSAGDLPVPGDYDGDGRPDLGVWRASSGAWSVLLSTYDYDAGHGLQRRWGVGAAGDVPVPADYDGDGFADLAVWRPSTGDWHVLKSSEAYSYDSALKINWGPSGEGNVPVPADYDGDGRADLAVWNARTGDWYVLKSGDANQDRSPAMVHLGVAAAGDIPMPGDYDADGRAEPAVWQAPGGTWAELPSLRDVSRGGDPPFRRKDGK